MEDQNELMQKPDFQTEKKIKYVSISNITFMLFQNTCRMKLRKIY